MPGLPSEIAQEFGELRAARPGGSLHRFVLVDCAFDEEFWTIVTVGRCSPRMSSGGRRNDSVAFRPVSLKTYEEKMKRLAYLVVMGIAVAFAECTVRSTQAQTQVKPREMAPAQVGIVNHTGNYMYFASVNGGGGGNMASWGAGIANMCCVSIPDVWYPGMKVRVRWNMPVGVKDVIKEKVVEVEKYDRPGDIYMNFFPNDEVRVVVSRNGPRSSDYPIRHSGNPNDLSTSNWREMPTSAVFPFLMSGTPA